MHEEVRPEAMLRLNLGGAMEGLTVRAFARQKVGMLVELRLEAMSMVKLA